VEYEDKMKKTLVISGEREYIDKVREYAVKTGKTYSMLARMAFNQFISEEAAKLGIRGFANLDELSKGHDYL